MCLSVFNDCVHPTFFLVLPEFGLIVSLWICYLTVRVFWNVVKNECLLQRCLGLIEDFGCCPCDVSVLLMPHSGYRTFC